MSKILQPLGCVLLILSAFVLSEAQVRAVWVRPFVGASEEIRRSPIAGREFIRRELEKIDRAGLNTIYLETFWDGYTIYPSRVAPQRPLSIPYGTAESRPGGGGFGGDERAAAAAGWDVLQVYLEEAQKLDLRIDAWLHVFHQWNSNLGGLEKSPIFSKHPDWAMLDALREPFVKSEPEGANRDVYKVFLSPSNPAARKYLRRVVSELTRKYPRLGGVQWDYIRYPLHTPETQFDYSPDALARFKRATRIDARRLSPEATPREWKIWREWKTRQVTGAVEELNAIVRRDQPGWEISAAVFPDFEENLHVKMQDPRTWAREGLVDALLPMLYDADYARVESWAREFKRGLPAKTKVYPALFISHFYDSRTQKIDTRYLELQTKFGFDGVGLFAAQSLTPDLIGKLGKKN